MDKKLTTGLLVGGLIGGGLVALVMSKKGRELCSKVSTYAEEVFKQLQEETFELADLTREKFAELAERAADEFVKKKELALETKDNLVHELEDRWRKMQLSVLFRDIKRQFEEGTEKTREAYEKLVERIAGEFADKRELGFTMRNKMMRELTGRWKEVKNSIE